MTPGLRRPRPMSCPPPISQTTEPNKLNFGECLGNGKISMGDRANSAVSVVDWDRLSPTYSETNIRTTSDIVAASPYTSSTASVGLNKSLLKDTEMRFDARPWMSVLTEESQKSFKSMERRMVKIHKRIVDLERAREKSSSLGQRRLLSRQIIQMEELCEKISEDIASSSLKTEKTITEFSMEFEPDQNEDVEEVAVSNATTQTDSSRESGDGILGWLTGCWKTEAAPAVLGQWPVKITIKKIGKDGYYEATHTFLHGGSRIMVWRVDGVPRNYDSAVLVDNKVVVTLPAGQIVEYSKHADTEHVLCMTGKDNTANTATYPVTFLYKRAC